MWPKIHVAGEDDIVFPKSRIERILRDYELVVCLENSGWIEIAGHVYPFRVGDVWYLKPGVPHTLIYDGVHRVQLMFCHHSWISDSGCTSTKMFVDTWPLYMPSGPHSTCMIQLFRKLLAALWRRRGAWEWEAAAALVGMCAFLEDNASGSLVGAAQSVAEPREVSLAKRYMEEHGADEKNVVKNAAKYVGLSVSQLNRTFHKYTGMSPKEWLNGVRLSRAALALVHGNEPIWDVAKMCGFSDGRYFSRFFRLHTGMTPSLYRRRYRIRFVPEDKAGTEVLGSGAAVMSAYPRNVHLSGSEEYDCGR